ncbi:MAG TPA: hypothetical protein VJY34_01625 [Roseiarcus sp.]|nr:hypothetical protein [Roseiarcus sp.]
MDSSRVSGGKSDQAAALASVSALFLAISRLSAAAPSESSASGAELGEADDKALVGSLAGDLCEAVGGAA